MSAVTAIAPPLVALETLPLDLVVTITIALGLLALIITMPKKKNNLDLSGPISTHGMEALAVHKYKASDYTVLDNILNPWWNWCAGLLPKTMAPNVVTLFGWLFYYPVDIILVVYSTSLEYTTDPLEIFQRPQLPPYPRIMYALGALAILWYQTFDAMDGKQARALGVAGPLGQIMDHGCDAVSTILVTILSCYALRVDFPGWFLLGFFLLVAFYTTNWGEKYTHVLMTSVSKYFGVTEGQYMSATVLLLPALFGADFWLNPLQYYFGYQDCLQKPSEWASILFQYVSRFGNWIPHFSGFIDKTCVGYDLNNLPLGYLIIWFLFVSGVYMLCIVFKDVAVHIAKDTRAEFEEMAEHGEIVPESIGPIIFRRVVIAYLDVVPFFATLLSCIYWYSYSLPNPAIGKDWYGAFFYHPLMSIIATSIVTVHLICQVIINSMSYSPNVLSQPLILPLLVLELLDIIPSFMAQPQPLLEPEVHFFVWCGIIVLCFVIQMRYALSVVQQIANLFGIYILKLGPG